MATRDEIVAAIRSVDARLDALKPLIMANGNAPLNEGTWRVRDALSHLAARANGVDRVAQRVRDTQAGKALAAPRSIDEINAEQVTERTTKSAAELLDEIARGHAAAIAAVGAIDHAILDAVLPLGFRLGESAASDLMLRGGPRHDNTHLDQIEAALTQMAGKALRPSEAAVAAAWGAMVDADAAQVARVREPEPSKDFYAPIAQHFRAGARPSAELPGLLAHAEPGDTWLDIGAGGGRFALPLSERVARVIAVEPSESMREVLERAVRERARPNIEVRAAYWPDTTWTGAVDVSLAAHSIYDVREIVPFLDAMERHTRRRCIAVLSDLPRGAHLARLFEAVHGEALAPLPALREFIALLVARGRRFDVATVSSEQPAVVSLDEAATEARRLLWLATGSEKDRRTRALIEEWWAVPGGIHLPAARGHFGIVAWYPPTA